MTEIEELVKRRAPVQGFSAGIPWAVHCKAYDAYVLKNGNCQSKETLAARGGFGVKELDTLYPDWRKESDALEAQAARIKVLESSSASKEDAIAELRSNLDDICKESEAQASRVKELERESREYEGTIIHFEAANARIAALEAQLEAFMEAARQIKQRASSEAGWMYQKLIPESAFDALMSALQMEGKK